MPAPCQSNAAPESIGNLPGEELLDRLERQAHLWLCFPEEDPDPSLLGRLRSLLSAGERQRHDRLQREREQRLFLVAHALTRLVLSRYLGLPPEALCFEADGHGRPELCVEQRRPERLASAAGGTRSISFNLSHTPGCVACLVSAVSMSGVDVQVTSAVADPLRVAGTYLSAAEQRHLQGLPEDRRRHRFFELWTLGEAYLKARGTVELSPESYTFLVDDEDDQIRVSFEPTLGDDDRDWQFELSRPRPEHVLALALRRGRSRDLEVVQSATRGLRSLLGPGGAR